MITNCQNYSVGSTVSKIFDSFLQQQRFNSNIQMNLTNPQVKSANLNQLTKFHHTLQTRKNRHKSFINKNLLDNQKQNIPQGLFTIIDSTLASNLSLLNDQTIKLANENFLQKKSNNQLPDNLDQQKQIQYSKKSTIQQKQSFQALKQTIKQLKKSNCRLYQQWTIEKQQLTQQLEKVKYENQKTKKQLEKVVEWELKINQLKKDLNQFNQQLFLCKKCQLGLSLYKQNQQNHLNMEEIFLIERICKKLPNLSKELFYFIQLSTKLKNQTLKLKSTITEKQNYYHQIIYKLQQNISNITQSNSLQFIQFNQKHDLLINELNQYKWEYEVLKKRHFMMEAEFRKYSTNFQFEKKQQDALNHKYENLMKKYNSLHDSYKSLYQQYMNKSRQTDFIKELRECDLEELKNCQTSANKEQFSQKYFIFNKQLPLIKQNKRFCHLIQESLSDCSDIMKPLESIEQKTLENSLQFYPRIVLDDLIAETLQQC